MIRKLLTIFLLCASSAATVTVRAKLTDGTGTVSKTAYLHFQLENCGPNIPSDPTIGAAAIQTNFDLRPNQPDGTILYTNLLSNDEIFCGGVASTYWVVTPMKDQSHPLRDGLNYVLHNGTTFDPSVTQAMITVPLAPPQDPLCCGSPLVQGQGTGGGGSGGGGSINCNSPNANVYWLFGLLCDPFFTDDGVGNFTAFSGTFIGPKAGWINLFPGPTPVVPSLPGFQLTAQTSMSGPVQWLAPSTVGALGLAICVQSTDGLVSDTLGYCAFSSGTGSVTSVACGNLSPLFTCAVSDPTNAAALAFTLSNAAANTVFGNFTGSSAGPSFNAMSACGDSTHALAWTAGTGFTCQTISAGTTATFQVNAVNTTSQTTINFQDTSTVAFTNPSAGNIQAKLAGSTTISTPTAPTLSTNGSAGATSRTYAIVGCEDVACVYHTPASSTTTIATTNATLTSGNSVNLSVYGDTLYGPRCFNVYRTASAGTPSTTGLIAACVGKKFIDTGLAGDGTTAPVTNTTILTINMSPNPGCNIPPNGIIGVDAPPCATNALDDEMGPTFQVPADTNDPFWTWYNQGSATAAWSGGTIILTSDTASNTIEALSFTLPSPPFTFEVYVDSLNINSPTTCGLGLSESISNHTSYIGFLQDQNNSTGASGGTVLGVTNTTSTSITGVFGNVFQDGFWGGNSAYLKIQDDGTNLKYSFSNTGDGVGFKQMASQTVLTPFPTNAPTKLSLISSSSTNGAAICVFDFVRRTQ